MPEADARGVGDVTIVTHAALPGGATDDLLLGNALGARGFRVRFAAWDDKAVDWQESPLTVIRSTWDYHRAPERWRAWVAHAKTVTRLLNPAELLLWNMDKRYLRSLAGCGVPCVPTSFVERGSGVALTDIAREQGWSDIVVKPAIAASATGARRFRGGAIATDGAMHLGLLTSRGLALVQPYMQEVETSLERSLVFISGVFSHAFTKTAFNTDAGGRSEIRPLSPAADELAVAGAVLASVPAATLYARVDLVLTDMGPLLMELELIEPDLGLRLSAEATTALTEAVVKQAG